MNESSRRCAGLKVPNVVDLTAADNSCFFCCSGAELSAACD